jgi:two-component sensor histidine kinase
MRVVQVLANVIVDIPRDRWAPREARAVVDELPWLDPAVVPDAKLLVSELVTNSVKYGGDGPVRLVLRSADCGRLRIEVVDRGAGFAPARRATDRPKTDIGGWGLHLVETLADRWGVAEGPTHVWFELGARGRGRPPEETLL